MSPYKRQQKILTVLCQRRFDTIGNLADEFDVSRRTISRDITDLMRHYPIETIRGHGGGIKVADSFYLNRKSLTVVQIALLTELMAFVEGDKLDILNSILVQFAP